MASERGARARSVSHPSVLETSGTFIYINPLESELFKLRNLSAVAVGLFPIWLKIVYRLLSYHSTTRSRSPAYRSTTRSRSPAYEGTLQEFADVPMTPIIINAPGFVLEGKHNRSLHPFTNHTALATFPALYLFPLNIDSFVKHIDLTDDERVKIG